MTKPNQPWFIRRPLPEVIKKVHLVGIAGSGMGAFACMLHEAGFEVRGTDQNVYPPMSDILRSKGIDWFEGWDPDNLNWDPDCVIVGNVCRRDNPEVNGAESREIPCISFPQALSDLFLAQRRPVVIAGTHGKTTTTALTAYLLHGVGLSPGMLVGGTAQNFGASFLIGEVGMPFVVEGDEYDTAYFDKGPKFLHYRPQIAVLNNIEFDHADIYDSLEEIVENFDRLMDIMGPDSLLLANADDALVMARAARSHGTVVTYGFSQDAQLRAVDIQPGPTGCNFTVVREGVTLGRVSSPMAGRHNVWNALAAFGVGLGLGVSFDSLVAALPGFRGTQRRQEEKGEARGVLVMDDYAHHPTAIRETLNALRYRYPDRRIWGVYEPKSNTARSNIHQRAYGEAFDGADRVVLAKPYVKDDGLSTDDQLDVAALVDVITGRGTPATYRRDVPSILSYLMAETQPQDLVVIMANSGFGGLTTKLLTALGEPI
jgi:UDP-N-acetylmuramate: L-alanyl-gamma-D-glutamyl-meso-diaminopimelate ligase